MKYTADMVIQDALDLDSRVGEVLEKLGWKCIECVAAEAETFRFGSIYHEKDLEELLNALNQLGDQE